MSDQEKVELFDQFINERGLWGDFVDFIESKGYTEKEFE